METARDRIGRYPIEERGGRCPVSPPSNPSQQLALFSSWSDFSGKVNEKRAICHPLVYPLTLLRCSGASPTFRYETIYGKLSYSAAPYSFRLSGSHVLMVRAEVDEIRKGQKLRFTADASPAETGFRIWRTIWEIELSPTFWRCRSSVKREDISVRYCSPY